MKRFLKDELLKPLYSLVAYFSPNLADRIRRSGYSSYFFLYALWMKVRQRFFPASMPLLKRDSVALLVDTTEISQTDPGTGIQRVVKRIFSEIAGKRSDVVAVKAAGAMLWTSFDYWCNTGYEGTERAKERRVSFLRGDKLLLLDSSWKYYWDFTAVLAAAAANESRVYAVVYDLILLHHPELAASREFVRIFRAWHDMVLAQADAILCISQTVADDVIRYYEKVAPIRNRPLEIHCFPMGADLSVGEGCARAEITAFTAQATTFLMVGTVEPRKGHLTVLQALQVLKDMPVQLLILGHDGWENENVLASMEEPTLKTRVLWISDAIDEELRWAYQNCAALIAASQAEGFGLPLIEAAYYGLPIICSDIPIFREVTQGYADYFTATDAVSLAEEIKRWLASATHPDSHRIRIYTWEEAGQGLLEILDEKKQPYKVIIPT